MRQYLFVCLLLVFFCCLCFSMYLLIWCARLFICLLVWFLFAGFCTALIYAFKCLFYGLYIFRNLDSYRGEKMFVEETSGLENQENGAFRTISSCGCGMIWRKLVKARFLMIRNSGWLIPITICKSHIFDCHLPKGNLGSSNSIRSKNRRYPLVN